MADSTTTALQEAYRLLQGATGSSTTEQIVSRAHTYAVLAIVQQLGVISEQLEKVLHILSQTADTEGSAIKE